MKKSTALVLALVQIFLLAACGTAEPAVPDTAVEQTVTIDFEMREYPLPDDITYLTAQTSGTEYNVLGGMDYYGKPVVGISRTADSFEAFDLPETVEFIYACCVYDDAIAVLSGDYPRYWKSPQGTQTSDSTNFALGLLIYNADGELVEEHYIYSPDANMGYHFYALCRVDGYFYIASRYALLMLNSDGDVLGSLSMDSGYISGMCAYRDAIVFAVNYTSIAGGDDSAGVYILRDNTNMEYAAFIEQDYTVIDGLGVSADNALLVNIDGIIYKANVETQEFEKIIDLSYVGLLDTDYKLLHGDESGISLFTPYQTATLLLVKDTENAAKIPLVIWTPFEEGILSAMVSRFNLTNDAYVAQLVVVDTDDAEQLKAKVATGEGPDVFYCNDLIMGEAKHENYLCDLTDYIESTENGKNCLVPGILDAVSENGAIYIFPLKFALYTFITKKSLGVSTGATMDEFLSAAEAYGGEIFQRDLGRSDVLYHAVDQSMDAFVDTDTGKCSFDSEAYVSLLEGIKNARDDDEMGSPDAPLPLLRFDQVGSFLRLSALYDFYGEDIIFMGAPAGESSNGSAFSIEIKAAISATSDKKDIAWQFLQTSFSTKLPIDFGLPTSTARLDAYFEQAYNGELNSYGEITLTPYLKEQLYETCANTRNIKYRYSAILEIVTEEAAKFFNGQVTAEEAAKATQSRATIYVAEQYG